MGSTSYDSNISRKREIEYSKMNRDEIFTSRKLNDRVNPFELKIREARDSDVHPNTIPIIVAFDVTGSMGRIPEDLVKNHFTKLMETLINNGLPDVTICFCAVGDHYTDSAPFQVGQFESGDIELDADLTSIWLEGNGGGQKMESYMFPWLFAARHTSTDSFEKRNKKGFLFTIGDEWNHPQVESKALKQVLGYKESSDEASEKLLKEAQEKWEVFHIHCSDGNYGESVSSRWKDLLGERCVIVDSSKIVDVITNTVLSNSNCFTDIISENVQSNSPQFIK